jgi:nitroreductase
MNQPKSISDIIRFRSSRRTYRPEIIPDEILENINQKIKDLSVGPLGTSIDYSLISVQDSDNQKLKLGTYGFIQGAKYFVAGQIVPSKFAFLDYGYSLERLIIEFTGMGLGTCWLGGTFDRGEFAKAINLKDGCVIPAITPVGYATAIRGLGDRLIRLGAGSRKRLPAEKLFFDKNPENPLVLPAGNPVESILESIRIAPSASNIQPWRIVANGNEYRFYLCRKPGYQKAFNRVDIQMIDMGIAMAHFDLVSREKGMIPTWNITKGIEEPDSWEYVISVLLP